MIFSAKGRKIKIIDAGGGYLIEGDPFEVLRETLVRVSPGAHHHRFTGGAVGYFSYDASRHIEELPDTAENDLELPDAVFMFCGIFMVFDHVARTAEITVTADDGDPNAAYGEARDRVNGLIEKMNGPAPAPEPRRGGKLAWESNFTKAEFCEAVERAKEYIRAGDVYQVNLSQRLKAAVESSPFEIYSELRRLNPSPFAGYFDFGDWQLVGCSPERLVKLENRIAQTRPIAGTIRRGGSEKEDGELKNRLTGDIKERAEHIMLVDLERNDLGRVCEYGSVRADELLVTESYSHVTHIVSNVVGRLREPYDGFDLARACFPGGTITGCPKVRAMEIIEELEPVRRGPYTGSMGYFGFNGDLDLNIIIRTLVMKDGLAYIQAGAGIVADSQPEREYRETLHKAEALVRATETVEESPECLLT
jgi:aminodeoxychorismate synthase component I